MMAFRAWLALSMVVSLGSLLAHGCGQGDEKAKSLDPVAVGGSSGGDASAGMSGSSGKSGMSGSGGAEDGSAGDADAADASDAGDAGDAAADAPLPAHCTNLMQDEPLGETDIDCGGPCLGCATGQFCTTQTDCASLRCDPMTGRCLASTCTDGTKNGLETDRDCGGACAPCEDGKDCKIQGDCKSSVCSGSPLTCQVPTCSDNVANGDEADQDCGVACTPNLCNRGKRCKQDADCETGECNSSTGQCECPPGMIIAPRPGVMGGNYCVDEHEVTYGEYNSFIQASVGVDTQDAQCRTWNTTFTPSSDWPPVPFDMPFPVAYADWCDAAAYCKWANKRLCGSIAGGSNGFGDYADHTKSMWHNACTAQGQNDYPYGDTYSDKQCVGVDWACDCSTPVDGGCAYKCQPQDWTSVPANRATSFNPAPCWQSVVSCINQCLGGATGLLDMSGNLAEWTDECNAAVGATDLCHVRGGSYDDGASGLRCDADVSTARNTSAANIGMRCCLD